MRHAWIILAGTLLAAPLPALAQDKPQKQTPCAAMDASLPPELAGWTARTALPAAATGAGAKAAALAIGKAVDVGLPPTGSVKYVIPPTKPGDSASHGGLFQIKVATAGTYVVALGAGAWIDVLKGKTAQASSAHSHGPECSTIRKMVDFKLDPGTYVIQISASGDASVPLMIARRP